MDQPIVETTLIDASDISFDPNTTFSVQYPYTTTAPINSTLIETTLLVVDSTTAIIASTKLEQPSTTTTIQQSTATVQQSTTSIQPSTTIIQPSTTVTQLTTSLTSKIQTTTYSITQSSTTSLQTSPTTTTVGQSSTTSTTQSKSTSQPLLTTPIILTTILKTTLQDLTTPIQNSNTRLYEENQCFICNQHLLYSNLTFISNFKLFDDSCEVENRYDSCKPNYDHCYAVKFSLFTIRGCMPKTTCDSITRNNSAFFKNNIKGIKPDHFECCQGSLCNGQAWTNNQNKISFSITFLIICFLSFTINY